MARHDQTLTSGIQFSVLIGCSYSLDFIHNQNDEKENEMEALARKQTKPISYDRTMLQVHGH